MASSVFGVPITDSTLKGLPEYAGKKIERKDRAHVALLLKNAGNKDVNAKAFAENFKQQNGRSVSTVILIYNATGHALTFATHKDWFGRIGAINYPKIIENGQWGAFCHDGSGTANGTVSAVAYNGINAYNEKCDWMVFWSNPMYNNNTVYTEIREEGHFDKRGVWDQVYAKGMASGLHSEDTWEGCKSLATITPCASASVEAIFSLTNA